MGSGGVRDRGESGKVWIRYGQEEDSGPPLAYAAIDASAAAAAASHLLSRREVRVVREQTNPGGPRILF